MWSTPAMVRMKMRMLSGRKHLKKDGGKRWHHARCLCTFWAATRLCFKLLLSKGISYKTDLHFQIQRYLVFSWRQTSRSPACNSDIYITTQFFKEVYRSCELICTAIQWSLLYLNCFISGKHAGRLSNYSGATKCI